mmetsp:Transcript_28576/g.40139  ORF Transcript_28576/g.40139 Transcript_28576/m.40139 type:complete len:104 (-) Transcript_28576:163-474(-)
MFRLNFLVALLFAVCSVNAFTAPGRQIARPTVLRMSDQEPVERGVSVDQDGKSNVWAIEPKVEVESKSSEEKTTSALIAVGGLAVFGVIAAGVLTNLPDPNQF